MIDAELIIRTVDDIARQHYRDGNSSDRLAYQVGMLEGKIRELTKRINVALEQIDEILADHEKKKVYLERVK